MTRPLVALDIGSTKVACAIGLPRERAPGFELLGSSLVPYPSLAESWWSDPLTVGRTIEQALEATAVSGDFDRALVSVNSPSLTSEQVQATCHLADEPLTVRAQDLERLQRRALDQALGVDREPLLIERLGCTGNGFEGVRDPLGLSAMRLSGTFHIVAMPISLRRAVVQAVESAGLDVAHLAYTLPSAMASATDENLGQRRILCLDIGGISTDVGIFVEGVLRKVQVIPWGGLRLATDIARELQATMDQALAWSLEGSACRKPAVRSIVQQQWQVLRQAMETLLKDEPQLDAALLCGRGALMDGLAEWIERTSGLTASICRSARTQHLGDLSRQVGLSAPIGMLEISTRLSADGSLRDPHLFNRLIDRTRTLLTEYF